MTIGGLDRDLTGPHTSTSWSSMCPRSP